MPTKTVYLSDLDGTLLNKDAELSEYTVAALNRLLARGVHFSVATARTAATVLHIMREVNLTAPLILMNGVLVYDPREKRYIRKAVLERGAAQTIIAAIRGCGLDSMMYTISGDQMSTYYERLESAHLREFILHRQEKYNKVFVRTDDFTRVTDDVIYFTVIDTQENVGRLCAALSGMPGLEPVMYRDIYTDDLWYLEIFSAEASKYKAAQFIKEHGGYDKVIGFGDNLNDLPLFRACDECYAVANARDELKAIATAVIGSNADDGVVKWLELNA